MRFLFVASNDRSCIGGVTSDGQAAVDLRNELSERDPKKSAMIYGAEADFSGVTEFAVLEVHTAAVGRHGCFNHALDVTVVTAATAEVAPLAMNPLEGDKGPFTDRRSSLLEAARRNMHELARPFGPAWWYVAAEVGSAIQRPWRADYLSGGGLGWCEVCVYRALRLIEPTEQEMAEILPQASAEPLPSSN